MDSLIVVLMSHGSNGRIAGVDSTKRNILSLVNFFNGDQCPAMLNKPKMFIVNACRGGMSVFIVNAYRGGMSVFIVNAYRGGKPVL